MTYFITGNTDKTFDSIEEAVTAGKQSGNVFAVIATDGTLCVTGVLITYKQQNGRKGKMWNIAYL
jgi:hypothetical protein